MQELGEIRVYVYSLFGTYIWATQKLGEICVYPRGLLSQFGKSGPCRNWEKFACTVNVYCHNSVHLGHAQIGRNSRVPSKFTVTVRYIWATQQLGEIRVYRPGIYEKLFQIV